MHTIGVSNIHNETDRLINVNIKHGDITQECVDAIVNAANNELVGGGGVDGAIHYAAGWDELDKACREIGYCKTGQAVITPAFQLKKINYIIHTFCGAHTKYADTATETEIQHLYNCYYNSLILADKYGCNTVSFPSIATGIYCFPLKRAPKIFRKAIENYSN